jgi:hypothetical protein
MTIRFGRALWTLVGTFFLTLFLAACGGSGAGGAGGSTSTVSGTAGIGSAGEKITVELVDKTTGAVISTVPSGGAILKVTVLNAAGTGITGRVITFSQGTSSVLVFAPPSALTDGTGIAKSLVTPGSATGGAVAVSASVALATGESIKSQLNIASAGTATGSTGIVTTTGPTLTLSIIDVATGTERNSISLSAATQLKALVVDGSGAPMPNQIVSFVPEATGILVMTPAGTSLTDSSGIATIFVSPASVSVAGAYAVTADTTISGTNYKSSKAFSIGVSNVAIASLVASAPSISAYGTTTVAANVSGLPTGASVKVQFSSTCSTNGKATLTTVADTVNGIATATYKDNACAGLDTVTATVQGASASKSTSVTSSVPGIANIGFIGATPQTIVLKGTGAAGSSEVSIVRFRVYDQNGQPYTTPTSVTFKLSTYTGGLKIDSGSVPVTKPSNGSGDVEVTVSAGTVPTPVTVTASLTDPVSGLLRATESIKLNVSTGRPSQNFFSLSASTFNIEGWQFDGVESDVTIRASDRLANPVSDGTGINFVAEGAQVQPTCQTVGGACSVKFTSKESRPVDGTGYPSTDIRKTDSGRVTILAYATGEESFVDLNGNNQYDAGETFTDLGYPYIDNLETTVYNAATHQVIPYTNAPGSCVNPPSGLFSVPSKPNTCDGKWGDAFVRRSSVLILSGSSPRYSYGVNSLSNTVVIPKASCAVAVSFYLQDVNGNPMAAGTALNADAAGANGLTASVGASPIADSTARGGTFNFVLFKGSLDTSTGACTGGGLVSLVVTSTKGLVSAFPFSVSIGP